ncbi:COX15/CtaA family protein [bacterium]|nr:COX15/CtaA family protein [bacterium]
MTDLHSEYQPGIHRLAKIVATSTFFLIVVGGLVTSTGSGLAVPDWPNTYGHFMFAFPFSKMVGGILYEHGHRMVATIVGFLMTVLAVWLWVKEPRKWVRWLGLWALVAVIAQGILGGITVLFLLPTSVSVMHACLAQAFFCMTLCLAVFTSKGWLSGPEKLEDRSKPRIQDLAIITTACVFLQLILGAIMRHTGAGLAIPDFPLAFGRIIPPIKTQAIAIHFLHRVGAVLVTLSVIATSVQVFRFYKQSAKLMRPVFSLLAALILQIVLAGLTIWTQKAVIPTTAHVAVGAFILANCLFLTLRAHLMLRPGEEAAKQGFIIQQPSVS